METLVIWERKNNKQGNFPKKPPERKSLESIGTQCCAPASMNTLTSSQAGLTSVLVKGGACNGAPPQLEVFLIHHHFPRLLFASWIFIPFCWGFWFWRVVVNSRAPKRTWHFLQPFHLINGSGEKNNRHGAMVGVCPVNCNGHTKTCTERCGFKTV